MGPTAGYVLAHVGASVEADQASSTESLNNRCVIGLTRLEMKVPRLRVPVYVNLDLTSNCNQKCIFCAVSPTEKSEFRPLGYFKDLIDQLQREGVFEITLFGGEPLMYPWVVEIAKYIYESGMEVNIVSNGTLYKKIPKLARYLENASVSIHGFKKTHETLTRLSGSYDLSLLGIQTFIENGVNTSVCYTLVKENSFEMGSFLDYIFSNYDITSAVMDRFVPRGFGKLCKDRLDVNVEKINDALASLDRLSRKYKKGVTTGDGLPICKIREDLRYIVQPCQAGILFCSITEDGDVKLCPSASTKIGNVFSSSLEEIWNSQFFSEFREFDWLKNICKECNLITNCYGGCKVSADIEHYSQDVLLSD